MKAVYSPHLYSQSKVRRSVFWHKQAKRGVDRPLLHDGASAESSISQMSGHELTYIPFCLYPGHSFILPLGVCIATAVIYPPSKNEAVTMPSSHPPLQPSALSVPSSTSLHSCIQPFFPKHHCALAQPWSLFTGDQDSTQANIYEGPGRSNAPPEFPQPLC